LVRTHRHSGSDPRALLRHRRRLLLTVGAGVAWVYSVLATLVPAGVVGSTFAFRRCPLVSSL
jgi:hypothetical protein